MIYLVEVLKTIFKKQLFKYIHDSSKTNYILNGYN